ncbi:MAG: hypothetical protein K2N72_08025 [Oscillospiraceae bacterium]|nr:hypothetical protein [Oscillospiraceae bacterium]
MREKFIYKARNSTVKIEENKITAFEKKDLDDYSYRFLRDGYVGAYYCREKIDDDEGYRRAEKNLRFKRPYKFELETGARYRDQTEKVLTDSELMALARETLAHINNKHPKYTLSGSLSVCRTKQGQVNDKGLDLWNSDCTVNAGFSFKHKDSKDIFAGYFGLGKRDFEPCKLYDMAENFLGNYSTRANVPGKIIVQMPYYGLLDMLYGCLNGENIALGTSLLSGRIGEKIFSEDFTLLHDVSDGEAWHMRFFDREGVTLPGDKLAYIENGVLLRGYADKKTAEKYGIEHTGSAYCSFNDIPENGFVNLRIKQSGRTVKELLDGRLSVVPVAYGGGGFNEKGDYTMPVRLAYLSDGERFLERLPEFTLVSNMFDMFGKDFIGVGSDYPIFNDKSVLVRLKTSVQ